MVNRRVGYLIDQLTDLPLNRWRRGRGVDAAELVVESRDGEVVLHMTATGSIVDIDVDADFLVESTEESLARVIADLIREGDRIRGQVSLRHRQHDQQYRDVLADPGRDGEGVEDLVEAEPLR
ncbi:hypothetical protein FB566_2520 [Stackebrandtia endophytica]|uniref:YbaB/EbfC DNA-binding family protein n=1 Tax=Stackebrandtia endophytica TaxID=1496996 RepID=A0A543AWN1_9ACTN|nr:hypothetical protein FB566_2520 [Stackebrandtia endophytica]